MKVNIVGLLKMAQRHLSLLDHLQKNPQEALDPNIWQRFEVISSEMILSELIENIEIVQKDPSQLDSFLKLYCIKKD